jgi:hypothetical protein
MVLFILGIFVGSFFGMLCMALFASARSDNSLAR